MLKEMKYVYAVFEERSFSKAARKLYISQPALSAAVKKVERRIHTPIFDRSTNPIEITEAGTYYIDSIKKIMDIYGDMEEYFNNLARIREERLNIGSSSFFCIYVLPAIVNEFKKEHPEVDINFFEGGTVDLSRKLENGKLDFVLDVETRDKNTFSDVAWNYENIVLAVPSPFTENEKIRESAFSFGEIKDGTYLLSGKKDIDLRIFANEQFLLLKRGNDMYRRAFAICGEYGFVPQHVMYLDQLMTAYYIACEGRGIAFIRDSITRYTEDTGKLLFYRIKSPLSKRKIKLFYKNNAPLPSIAEAFVDFIRENHSI